MFSQKTAKYNMILVTNLRAVISDKNEEKSLKIREILNYSRAEKHEASA